MCEDGLNLELMDELVPVTGEESVAASLKMAATNGIFTGISGGGSVAAALKVAATAEPGTVILTMLPDTAERYMSTPLFAAINAGMNDEELEIAKSTPSYQLLPGEDPVLAA